MKKAGRLFLSVLLFASILLKPMVSFSANAYDSGIPKSNKLYESTIESILAELEAGEAVEVFECRNIEDLSEEEIESDEGFQAIVSGIELCSLSTINKTGTIYTDTITDSSGAVLRYTLCPKLKVQYSQVGNVSTTLWTSKLEVEEYVTYNGVIYSEYSNRIKLKNIHGEIGVDGNAIFYDDVVVEANNFSNLTVNKYGLLASLISNGDTITALLNAFSNLTYSGTVGYKKDISGNNIVGIEMASKAVMNNEDQSIKMKVNLTTKDETQRKNTNANYAFRWRYDVYKGSSKAFSNQNIKATGTTKTNYDP